MTSWSANRVSRTLYNS